MRRVAILKQNGQRERSIAEVYSKFVMLGPQSLDVYLSHYLGHFACRVKSLPKKVKNQVEYSESAVAAPVANEVFDDL